MKLLPDRFNSLTARLIVLVLCTTLIAWLLFTVALQYEVRKQTAEQQGHQLAAYADMLWQSIGDQDDLHVPVAHKLSESTLLAFALYRQDGTLLVASSNPPLPKQTVIPSGQVRFANESWMFEVRQDNGHQLVVGETLSKQEEIAEEVDEKLALPALGILLLLLPVLIFAIHRGLQPLRAVNAALSLRAPDNLDPIDLPAPREITRLLQRLNTLFGKVSATLDRERRFTADAAHELRTPLAALRVQLEIAQNSPRPLAREKALAQALVGLDRSTRLLGQLLELARLDDTLLPQGDPLDLSALARSAMQDAGLPCDDKHLFIRNRQLCHGHAGLIGLLLRNLLDNARRYAGQEATIIVQVENRTLTVSDDGPGVAPDVLIHLGERFFRPPGQMQPGAGLGLSIVQRIAELHGGNITLSNLPEGGFQVIFSLPS
ncbi:MAG: ATP-binding protein [Formivibrio sp.]|nr:ATP-binding protein [Formivibrio sp.]